MGVAAGLLHLRNEKDKHHGKNFLHDIFPWTFSQIDASELSQEELEKSWNTRVDRNALVIVLVVLISLARTLLPGLPYLNLTAQFVFVHLQLVIIVGLCRDGGRSWLSWVCR